MTFTETIEGPYVLYAHNNNVVRFNRRYNLVGPGGIVEGFLWANIATIEFQGVIKRLYASPRHEFMFNFVDWFRAIGGFDQYEDNLNVNIEQSGINYDWTNRSLVLGNVKITTQVANRPVLNEIKNIDIVMINGLVQIMDARRKFPLQTLKKCIPNGPV